MKTPLAMTAWLIVLLCSCSKPTSILAKVDNQTISSTDLAIRLSQIPGFLESNRTAQTQTAQAVLESMIDDRLLFIEAQAQKITVSSAQIDHAIEQHRALLGDTILAFFTNRKNVSQNQLRRSYEEQLCVLEYLKRVQIQQKPFCDSFDVQSPQNCTKRDDFMRNLRTKHPVFIADKATLANALNQIVKGDK